jgi:hypothetical protein
VALGIQDAYCGHVRRYVERHPELPIWCRRAAELWSETLQLLRDDPLALCDRLDPFIKLALFDAALAHLGRDWPDVATDRELYHKLAMLDLVYHRLGSDQPFAEVHRRARLVDSPAAGTAPAAAIREVVERLPTRAAARARLVAEYSGQGSSRCGWTEFRRLQPPAKIDLGNPLSPDLPPWLPLNGDPPPPGELVAQASHAYDHGDYELARQLLDAVAGRRAVLPASERRAFLCLSAWVQSRRGYLDGVVSLDEIAQGHRMNFQLINDYACVYRFQGLTPTAGIEDWITRGEAHLAAGRRAENFCLVPFHSHVGYFHLRRGRLATAELHLKTAYDLRERVHPHVAGRVVAEMAELYRLTGQRRHARELLREAERLHETHRFEADLAEFTFAFRAKLEAPCRATAALEWLDRAATIQLRLQHHLGRARTLLLRARIADDCAVIARCRDELVDLSQRLPALAQCTLAGHILSRWDAWTADDFAPDENGDPFWSV